MFSSTAPLNAQPDSFSSSPRKAHPPSSCVVFLLAVNALILLGILTILIGAAVVAAPLARNLNPESVAAAVDVVAAAKPLISKIDANATHEILTTAAASITSISSFFNVTYKTTLLPPSLPDFLNGLMRIDVAPAAAKVSSVAGNVVSTLSPLGPFDDYTAGNTYASAATSASAVKSFANVFSAWVPPSTTEPPAPPSWIEKLIFGNSIVDWLNAQVESDRLHRLGDICNYAQQQVSGLSLPGITYASYTYDTDPGSSTYHKLKINDYSRPISIESMKDFLDAMSNVCSALKSA